jgi:multidrug efflux pump subunit AcrB
MVAKVGDAPPDVFLTTVTLPLEQALTTVLSIERVKSRTIRGAAEISLQFTPSTDMWRALQVVHASVAEARAELPDHSEIAIEKITTGSFPVVTFNLSGPVELREFGELVVRPEVEVVLDPRLHHGAPRRSRGPQALVGGGYRRPARAHPGERPRGAHRVRPGAAGRPQPRTRSGSVSLSAVTELAKGTTSSQWLHAALQPVVAVTADHKACDLGSIARDIDARIAKLELRSGYRLVAGGQIESERRYGTSRA